MKNEPNTQTIYHALQQQTAAENTDVVFEHLHLLQFSLAASVMVSNGSIKSLCGEALVKHIPFRLNRLSGNADDPTRLSDRLCTAHSLYSCTVQTGL